MSSPWVWVVPSGISACVLVVSYRTFRIVKRQSQSVGWTLEVDRRPGSFASSTDTHLIIRRTTGPAVRGVEVKVPEAFIVRGRTSIERLDPGGFLDVYVGIVMDVPAPDQVIVEWDGRFGRRRTWRSGL